MCHQRIHTRESQIIGKDCDEECGERPSLSIRKRNKTTEERQFKNQVYKKRFKKSDDLTGNNKFRVGTLPCSFEQVPNAHNLNSSSYSRRSGEDKEVRQTACSTTATNSSAVYKSRRCNRLFISPTRVHKRRLTDHSNRNNKICDVEHEDVYWNDQIVKCCLWQPSIGCGFCGNTYSTEHEAKSCCCSHLDVA